jgi:hypothetical protein
MDSKHRPKISAYRKSQRQQRDTKIAVAFTVALSEGRQARR